MAGYFICLANSYKNRGHCIAGILAHRGSKTSSVILDTGNKVIWIRPVCRETNYQEIPSGYAAGIKLLDMVEFNEIGKRPVGHQTENVEIDPRSLRVISHCRLNEIALRAWASKDQLIFGDNSRYISHDDIGSRSNSLMLIKPDRYSFYAYTKDQARSKFDFKQNRYDLPVTDIDLSKEILSGQHVDASSGMVYFTLSLGHLFNNNYYKLIAGVLRFGRMNEMKGPKTSFKNEIKDQIKSENKIEKHLLSLSEKSENKLNAMILNECITYPRAYEKWTKKEMENMLLLYNKQMSVKYIANILKRRPNAIKSMLRKQGKIK